MSKRQRQQQNTHKSRKQQSGGKSAAAAAEPVRRSHTPGRKNYLRKYAVAHRYKVCTKTVERMVPAGRLPPPMYLPQSPFPLWDEDVLDAHDAALAAAALAAHTAT